MEFIRLERRPLVVETVGLEGVLDDAGSPDVLEVRRDARLPEATGNRALLTRAVGEVLGNAAKFGASRAVVEVRVDGPWVYLSVTDDGPGVPPDLREAAFDLFRLLQAKGRHPGVGAGLALVRRIAAIHGGHAWIESGAPGTRVVLRFLGTGRSVADG
ncbi:MAG: ATP-binding protein [Acidimicrobiia bacterium]|nr:ATP-binding protein [Acidimicrobiia bacterium]